MKKLIITSVLLVGASLVSFAQDSKPATAPAPQHSTLPVSTEQMAQRRAKMDERLFTLTPEQSKGAYDIELEFTTALEKYRASGEQPSKGQMDNLTIKKDARMKTLLTAEQYTKYDMMRNKGHNAPMPPAQQQQKH